MSGVDLEETRVGPIGAGVGELPIAAGLGAERGGPAESERIGPYTLVRKLGEGGMGQVWLADQTTPVKRQVALKLIRSAWSDADTLSRFEAERQALAIMDHPAIAKVFDAGRTSLGQPYFVMEYVAGLPVTEYCDDRRLSTPERLELFIKICEGVQHAHQKAIIHRDLKPSNILVTEVDGRPMPRIIDFGIAKAVSQTVVNEETLLTQVGALMGTPEYMSPEQADPSVSDIDTRTDVYSLGVVLYEMLAGCLPFAKSGRLSLQETLQRLREVDPPTPSSRLAKDVAVQATSADRRGTTGKQLVGQLRGDLDWITMKALEKDRNRRYGTPSEMAADVRRYLDNEPVEARPASTRYRLSKYVRRHRIGVGVAAGTVLLLAAGAVLQAVQLRRTTRERDRANRISDFMTAMFKVSDPSEARGNDIRAREILDKASTQIDTGLRNDPELQAQMMQVMGDVYESLGLFPQAESLTRRSLEIRGRVLGKGNRETLRSMSRLVSILDNESRYPEAESVGRQTLEARTRSLGAEDHETVESMSALAGVVDDEGHYAVSEALNRDALRIALRRFGPKDPTSIASASHLAVDLAYQDKFREAESIFREVLEMQRSRLGPTDPKVLNAMNNLGSILLKEEKYAESEALMREVLESKRRVLGPEHPDTLLTMGNLGLALRTQKKYSEGEALFRETLEIKQRRLGPEHRSTLVTIGNLAELLEEEGKSAEAEQLIRKVLEVEERTLGREHSDTLYTRQTLADILAKERRYPEAERVYEETYDERRRTLGLDYSETARSTFGLGAVYALEGRPDEAFATLHRALEHGLPASDGMFLESDPDLKSLRGDPRFAALIAYAHERAALEAKSN